nr:hypothetical protein [Tanacetum cinerariifolium]
MKEIVTRHGVPVSIIFDRDEVGDAQLTGPEIIHETTEKIIQIKSRVVRFGKQGKLNSRYIGPFKKCLSKESLVIPLDELHIDDKIHFVEEPVKIMDHEIKQLKRSRIPIIKVRWNSKRGPEFTWERDDQFKQKYPHLFTKTAPSSSGGGLPVPDLQMMEELCQPTLNGGGGPIAPIANQAMNFRLKNDMIQQVQNSCPFPGPGDDANKHLDKFLHVTQSMKVNGVSDDALLLAPSQWALFPTSHFSLFFIPKDFYTNLVDIPG